MKIFSKVEILKLNEKQIVDWIINKKFEFETNSKDSDKEKKFNAVVLDFTLAVNGMPYDLKIKINGENQEKELNLINIKSMKQI